MVQFVSGENEEITMLSGFCLLHTFMLFLCFLFCPFTVLSDGAIAGARNDKYLLILLVCDRKSLGLL